MAFVAAGLQPDGRTCEGRARPLDRPCPTVSARSTTQLVREIADLRYQRIRTLTVAERATLQSIPYVRELSGRTVGNAVPPPLARAVVAAILAS